MKQQDSKLKLLPLATKATIFDLDNEVNTLDTQIKRARKAGQDTELLERRKKEKLDQIRKLKNQSR